MRDVRRPYMDCVRLLDEASSEAACIESLRQVGTLAWRRGDAEAIQTAEKEVAEFVARESSAAQRRRRFRDPTPDEAQFRGDEVVAAEKRVRVQAASIWLPHAAHMALPVEVKRGVINVGRNLEVTSVAANS